MASLSSKLAGIVLNAFNHGNHLGNMNGQANIVINEELGRKNFKHAGEHLCELWNRDPINGDQLFQLMLKSIMILYFQIFKKQHGNGLIATHKFANTLLIYANVRIEVAVDHHELLMLLNFYH
jgi:hypothetical protein